MLDRIVAFFEDHLVLFLIILLIVMGLISGLTGEMHHV